MGFGRNEDGGSNSDDDDDIDSSEDDVLKNASTERPRTVLVSRSDDEGEEGEGEEGEKEDAEDTDMEEYASAEQEQPAVSRSVKLDVRSHV